MPAKVDVTTLRTHLAGTNHVSALLRRHLIEGKSDQVDPSSILPAE